MMRSVFVALVVTALVTLGAPMATSDPSALWGTSPESGSQVWPGVTVTVAGGGCVLSPGADSAWVRLRYYNGTFGLEQDYELLVAPDGTWSHSLVVPPEWVDPVGYVLVNADCVAHYPARRGLPDYWGATDIYNAPDVRFWLVAEHDTSVGPEISVDAQGGSNVTVNGSNFPANEDVTISIESTRTTLGTVVTDLSGTFSATYAVPCTIGNGPHTIFATIVSSGREASASIAVSGCESGTEVEGASVTATDSATRAVSSQPSQTG